jgi:mono/diheme cytochrome c family protein
MRLLLCAAAIAAARWVGAAEQAGDAPAAKVDFAREVQPVFVEHCYQCHGPDKLESGLRLDIRERALAGGDSGPLLVAGRSGESEIVRRIASSDDDERMPPPGARDKPLSPEQIRAVTLWIDQGAAWPQAAASTHWAFRPIARPAPPGVKNEAWPRNPIDRFVLARLEARGVAPADEADRYTLAKRLWYDLLGLPPDLEAVDAFVRDVSPGAYEKLVDRLLDSPHFGERWGRRWLDLARYADSDGYEKDNPRPDAWRYRDWVIDAVNADMPLDRFAVEQLAGDLLPGATPSERLATAFHRQTLTNTEGGADQEQFRVEAIFDRVATTGSVWLGLTVGCAQCHSHKYDPISHEEYYRLFAFFNNGDEVETEVPLSGEALAKWTKDHDDAERKLAALEPKLADARAQRAAELPAWEAELRKQPVSPLTSHLVELFGIESSAGSQCKLLSDGSYLLAGKNPDVDKVTISARTDLKQITGFRLEVLADDSLGGRGPGRTEHGNFVLSEFRAFAAASAEFKPENRVELAQAEADFAQDQFPAAAAIDGKEPTGWAIGSQTGRDHWAVFIAKQPIAGDATPWLRLVLSQNHGLHHTIGRFRVLALTGSDPLLGVPQNIREIVAKPAGERSPEQTQTLVSYFADQDSKIRELAEQAKKLRDRVEAPALMKVRAIAQRTANPRTSHLLHRGDFLQPEAEVGPGTPGVLPPLVARGPAPDRLDLARWLSSPGHPLVPRVVVNHLWSSLFGRGIVRTAGDFGVRGQPPTHPELLDWLATELVRRGWTRKDMIRLVVTSATYRQASKSRADLGELDPANDWLGRQNRFRVEAEIVRDLSLAASGLLSEKIGGPSVFPPLPPDIAELSYAGNFKWTTSPGEDRYRRGMYTFFKRTAPHPNLTTFDCPDSNTVCIERQTSNTPLQALVTLNNESFVEAAQALSRRLLAATAANDNERLALGLRWCIARPPTADELRAFGELLATSRQWYVAHPADTPAIVGPIQPASATPVEAAAWVATARIMLNLDEFLTRE